jgi:hypothetical protein
MAGEVQITCPRHGDVLNRHDGEERADTLVVRVEGTAPAGAVVTVNGTVAHVQKSSFSCDVPLRERANSITAACPAQRKELSDTITVLWDKGSRPRYRLSLDDNIHFLQDLSARPEEYGSIFDHWYLGFLRQMHQDYAAKIHVNIYFQTVGGESTLREVPDRWRSEWEENAHWLRLSFHALQDLPANPYRSSGYEEMAQDMDLVHAEITRFAGARTLSATTTVHWAEGTREVCQAARDRGVRVLVGLFDWGQSGERRGAYYLDEAMHDHLSQRDAWYEPTMDMLFVTCDRMFDFVPTEQIESHLQSQAANSHTGELIEMLGHEPYFRPDSPLYRPDHQHKVRRILTWLTDHGYEPVFWEDGLLGSLTGFA